MTNLHTVLNVLVNSHSRFLYLTSNFSETAPSLFPGAKSRLLANILEISKLFASITKHIQNIEFHTLDKHTLNNLPESETLSSLKTCVYGKDYPGMTYLRVSMIIDELVLWEEVTSIRNKDLEKALAGLKKLGKKLEYFAGSWGSIA